MYRYACHSHTVVLFLVTAYVYWYVCHSHTVVPYFSHRLINHQLSKLATMSFSVPYCNEPESDPTRVFG